MKYFIVSCFLLASFSAHATLYDRGNGLVYDSDQDITWMKDANYIVTSGADPDGVMNWYQAKDFVGNLTFAGYDDWRLPTVEISDLRGDGQLNCEFEYANSNCGFNVLTTGSELAYLFTEILGNVSFFAPNGSPNQAGYGANNATADGVTFQNLTFSDATPYWFDTTYAPNHDFAWVFNTGIGLQDINSGKLTGHGNVWAVRDGDVAQVPTPAALLVLAAGLIGLGLHRRC